MIPAASTTIRTEENDTFDPDEEAAWTPKSTGIRAHIDITATPAIVAGQVVSGELWADPCELELGYRVVDERTGTVWATALWVVHHPNTFGLGHVRAGLSRVEC